ncbi:hypothetical protein EXIGLDRAFT_836885 [Exidia glandulosa HHB12029]|uniref:Uncharacterized protein n=1 Tax=Exidia glandulosa HHB12029 TaxID=1314781 RepID=A0A165HC95_EXIGL|nr:hypothetical protein EXIGLDRAFT_836885 [Exidia glandulosa HHB12029]
MVRSPFDYDIDSSLTAIEIGTFVSMFLLGVATLQAWNYFRDFQDDPWYIKLMVASVFGADVLHSALFCHAAHHYTVGIFHNILLLVKTVWSLEAVLILEAFIILLVQCYFGLRVQRVTRSTFVASILWVLAVFRAALTLSMTSLAIQDGTLIVTDTPQFRWQGITELSVGAFTDVGTALALCVGLLKSRTGFEASDRLIDRLVAFTVVVWIAFFSICSKTFSNSLLASLNQRGANRLVLFEMQQRRGIGSSTGTSTSLSFGKRAYPGSSIELSPIPHSPLVNKRVRILHP